jgi:hypothetical protein
VAHCVHNAERSRHPGEVRESEAADERGGLFVDDGRNGC